MNSNMATAGFSAEVFASGAGVVLALNGLDLRASAVSATRGTDRPADLVLDLPRGLALVFFFVVIGFPIACKVG